MNNWSILSAILTSFLSLCTRNEHSLKEVKYDRKYSGTKTSSYDSFKNDTHYIYTSLYIVYTLLYTEAEFASLNLLSTSGVHGFTLRVNSEKISLIFISNTAAHYSMKIAISLSSSHYISHNTLRGNVR